jgi:hypothetical protein
LSRASLRKPIYSSDKRWFSSSSANRSYVTQRRRPRWRKGVRTSRQSKMKTQRSLSSTLGNVTGTGRRRHRRCPIRCGDDKPNIPLITRTRSRPIRQAFVKHLHIRLLILGGNSFRAIVGRSPACQRPPGFQFLISLSGHNLRQLYVSLLVEEVYAIPVHTGPTPPGECARQAATKIWLESN